MRLPFRSASRFLGATPENGNFIFKVLQYHTARPSKKDAYLEHRTK